MKRPALQSALQRIANPSAVMRLLACVCVAVGLPAPATVAAAGIPAECRPSIPKAGISHGLVASGNVAFRAEASEQVVQAGVRCAWATMSSVAYVAEPVESSRPVTFLFNGGPGAATVALRESLGPRIARAANGTGFEFADNPDTILDATDLVFIDAPGTGYGRFSSSEAAAQFLAVDEDARAFAAFIEGWLHAHDRFGAPVFLVGESYGAVRASIVAGLLIEAGVPLQGVVLVSPNLSTRAGTSIGQSAEDLLPTLAVVARFHGRGAYLGRSVAAVAGLARGFALGPYAAALRHKNLTLDERTELAEQISRFAGIAPSAILERKLTLDQVAFVNLLLSDRQERVGRMDGRMHAPLSITRAREPPYDDPAMPPFAVSYDQAVANESYFRDELEFQPGNRFVRLNLDAYERWNWQPATTGSTLVPQLLGQSMRQQPRLRLMVLLGYYDLAVPFAGVLNEFSKTPLPRGRLEMYIFESGHAVLGEPATRAEATEKIRRMMRRQPLISQSGTDDICCQLEAAAVVYPAYVRPAGAS